MKEKKIKVGVIGAAGYTGGEMCRLLLNHPSVDLIFAQSRSQVGKLLSEVHIDLLGETSLSFTNDYSEQVDVAFMCLNHGESKQLLSNSPINAKHIVDLGNDFRLGDNSDHDFVYGLPEWQRDKIKKAKKIANPGCFATAIQLGLIPLASHGLLSEVHSTGITGATGAGQALQPTTHFSWRANNISGYKTLTHQHIPEINRVLKTLQPNFNFEINFVPWRGDFTRGIFVSSVLNLPQFETDIKTLYENYYYSHPFTYISKTMINLKQVVNTNKCVIHVEIVGKKLIIHSALDNLLKGACGQAIQNMNLMLGLAETAGLKLKPSIF